jgi:hypothetical protein
LHFWVLCGEAQRAVGWGEGIATLLQRPLAPVQHRYDWRYLVGFVHPASGRTLFHLATSVSISLFAAELAEFAQAVGASAD